MLSVASLGSGSRGNATVVRSGDQCILIDCGFNFKQLSARLARAPDARRSHRRARHP